MPKVTVQSQTTQSANEAYQKIKTMLETDPELRRMDPSCSFSFNEGSLSGTAKGSKFSANMKVVGQTAGNSMTMVTIDVDLPLLLTPVKGLVQSTLEKKLKAALA